METQTAGLDQVVVMLLRSRAELKSQLARAEGALVALGVDLDDPDVSDVSPERQNAYNRAIHGGDVSHTVTLAEVAALPLQLPPLAAPARPIRSLVSEVLADNNRWMTNAEVTEIVLKQVRDGRPEDKLKANVRSSLWSLKKQGNIVVKDGKNLATKWLNDTAATPGDTGIAAGSTPTSEGGDTGEDHLRAHDSLRAARDQDDRLGGSVAEAVE